MFSGADNSNGEMALASDGEPRDEGCYESTNFKLLFITCTIISRSHD